MLFLYLSLIDTPEEQTNFEVLYNTYKKDMYIASYSVVHNQHDAEDAIHNAFLAIIPKFTMVDQLTPQQQKAYLCRSARNSAINILSKQHRDTEFISSYMNNLNSSDDEEDILTEICIQENAKYIKTCILSLPDKYRDVLHLYYVECLDTNQIAKKLGLKIPTVRQRLLRGKRLLIKLISTTEDYRF